jgi:predicted nuclease of restriction endonuclease-like (RecB) superfamily
MEQALFYVRKTIENGWSRSVLMNFLEADLYAAQGKALSSFSRQRRYKTAFFKVEVQKLKFLNFLKRKRMSAQKFYYDSAYEDVCLTR